MKTVSKSLTAALLAIVSAQANATEIDDLVNASQSIRDTFAYGIKTIAGGEYYATKGGIAPAMAEAGHIQKSQQDAYNAAVAAVQASTYTYDPGADQYFQDQADQAINTVTQMIDKNVQAAVQIVLVAEATERTQADSTGTDDGERVALHDFM